jgi:predicted RNA-binding Zn-ribbon protein involved in translation (DUF1610 family)
MRILIAFILAVCLLYSLPFPALGQTPASEPPAPVVYVCPVHPDVQSKIPGTCPKCGKTLLASSATSAGDGEFYVCPMHPDVMATQAGKCPRCGMDLVHMAAPEVDDFTLRMEEKQSAPGTDKSEKLELRFRIFNPRTEEAVKEFNLLHDMPFHLFIVSLDLEVFQHIHPKLLADGSFIIDTVLPRPGFYKVFCDFFPVGGLPQVHERNLVTNGFDGDLVASQAALVPDRELVKTVDGMRCELKLDPGQPLPGQAALLKYHLVDAASGSPVTDLEPYLGAWGHTLVLNEDATDYLHSHPTSMIPEGADRTKLKGGPDVTFDTFFPHPGNYRIWSQFQHHGKITTVSFTVRIAWPN